MESYILLSVKFSSSLISGFSSVDFLLGVSLWKKFGVPAVKYGGMYVPNYFLLFIAHLRRRKLNYHVVN